ncbi:MAG TPA: hypothetical protein VJS64_09615, partial [Pyrinomonadaceae bacterium]|nr:hypothetical protein [Pyrinomonadaceae bacterium]
MAQLLLSSHSVIRFLQDLNAFPSAHLLPHGGTDLIPHTGPLGVSEDTAMNRIKRCFLLVIFLVSVVTACS